MTRERKLLFDAGLLFFFGVIASFLGYLIRMILSRQLTLEEFGLFYSVFTFVGFFIVFRDAGLSISLMKFIPEFLVNDQPSRIKASIKFIFIVNFIFSLILILILILFSDYLSKNYFGSDLAKPLLFLLSTYFLFYSLYRVFMNIFVGFQKSKYYSWDLLFINLVVLLGILIFSEMGIFSPAIAYIFAAFLGVFISIIVFLKLFKYFRYKSDYSSRLKTRLFHYGFPLLLAAIGFVVIGQIDVMMLTGFRTLSEVGIYSVVLPTAMLLVTLGSSMAQVILPYVSEYWAKKKYSQISKVINETYRKAFVFIVPAGLILFVFSDIVLRFLFGEEFILGINALKILSVGAILFSVATINNSILSAIGRPKLVTKIILSVTFLNVILNLILIPFYGIVGAAIATSISYLLVLYLSSKWVSKIVGVKIPVFSWLKSFFSGLVFVGVVAILKKVIEVNIIFESFLVLFIGLLVYLGVIFSLKVISPKEFFSLFNGIKK
jgi:O-antigen/teichoic acid export membrane protein